MFKWFKTKKQLTVLSNNPGAITYSTNTHTYPPTGSVAIQSQQQAYQQMAQAQGNNGYLYQQQSLQSQMQAQQNTPNMLGYVGPGSGSNSMIFGTPYIGYNYFTHQQWEQQLEPLNTYKRATMLNEYHATNEQFDQWEEYFKKKKHHEQFNDDLNEILNEPE